MREIRVCGEGELSDGAVRIVRIDALEIGVIRHAGKYFAYRNMCPHQGGPACEGIRMPGVRALIKEGLFEGNTFDNDDMHIVCPWHGYEYRLSNGENVCDPRLRLQKFEVVEREGAVYVAV